MAMKVFFGKRMFYVWKTEKPEISVTYKSPVFSMYHSEWCYEFRAEKHQSYSEDIILWSMYLKTTRVCTTFHNMPITLYLMNRDHDLEPVGAKAKDSKRLWSEYESEMLERRSELLVNGSLTFVFVLDPPVESRSDLEERNEMDRRWIQTLGRGKLSEDIGKILDNREHSDMLLNCNDERNFSVHKCILSARSEVFAAMFRSNMSESNKGAVTIRDIEAPVLDLFLRYIYSGEVDTLSTENAHALYKAADKYAVDLLRRRCAMFMVENLTKDNACDTLLFAYEFGDDELMDATISFMVGKKDFLRSEVWRSFGERNQAIGFRVMQRAYEDLSFNKSYRK